MTKQLLVLCFFALASCNNETPEAMASEWCECMNSESVKSSSKEFSYKRCHERFLAKYKCYKTLYEIDKHKLSKKEEEKEVDLFFEFVEARKKQCCYITVFDTAWNCADSNFVRYKEIK